MVVGDVEPPIYAPIAWLEELHLDSASVGSSPTWSK